VEGGVTGSSTFYEGKWQVSAWKLVSGAAEVRFRESPIRLFVKLPTVTRPNAPPGNPNSWLKVSTPARI